MLNALKRVKKAVATKDLVVHMTHYLVDGGFVRATDGTITACAPFPDDRTYMVPAVEFDKALDRLGEGATVTTKEDAIRVSKGRFSSTIRTLDPESATWTEPEGQEFALTDCFWRMMKKLSVFVSDNATKRFAMHYFLHEGRIYVTNNVTFAYCTEQVVDPSLTLSVPCWVVDFVLGQELMPPILKTNPENNVSFIWDDGSWVRSQLDNSNDAQWPYKQVAPLLQEIQAEWEIPEDWKKAYETVVGLCEEHVHITPDKIKGAMKKADTEAEIETPVSGVTTFNPKYLDDVIELATHWNPDLYPRPTPWQNSEIKGLVLGAQS